MQLDLAGQAARQHLDIQHHPACQPMRRATIGKQDRIVQVGA